MTLPACCCLLVQIHKQSGRRVKMNADAIHEVTSGGLLVGAEALGFDGMHMPDMDVSEVASSLNHLPGNFIPF